ncbi:MAG TPA: DUF998 domain-containing protein [Pseudonocardia sp.]|uniref:DUF998 domain-containing protein n=1 Tax=Pseudonocardia sp. TaxID=60912 RepID=UPI002EDA92F3
MSNPPVPTISDPVTTGRASAVERAAAALPTAGLSLLSVGSLLILLLHVLPPSNRVDPMTRTISQYALESNGWMFDVGVLALAVGSMAVLAGLVRAGVVRAVSGTSLFITFWSASLTVLVIFEKYDFQNGQHTGASGMIHRMASLVAFLSLPLAVLLASRGAARRNPGWRRPAAWTRWAGIVSCACLSLLIYAIVRGFVADVSWWRVFPLGALERLIALSDILAVSVLGVWARMARTVAAEALIGSAGLADQVSDGPGGAALVQ